MAIGDTAGNTYGGRGHLECVRATLKDGYAGNAKTGVEMESRLLFKFPNLGEMMTLGSYDAMIYALRGRVDKWSGRKLSEEVDIRCKDAYGNAGTGHGGGRDGGEAPGAVTGGGGSLSRRIGTSLIREGLCIEFYLLINSHVLRINHVKKVYARAIISTIKGVGAKCRWQQVEEEHLSQLGGSGTIRVSNLIFHPTSTIVLYKKRVPWQERHLFHFG